MDYNLEQFVDFFDFVFDIVNFDNIEHYIKLDVDVVFDFYVVIYE